MHPLHETLKDTATRDLIIADQRCTGRSTVIALDLLSTAMKNPRQWIPIKDHSTSLDADLIAARRKVIAKLMSALSDMSMVD